MEWIRCPECGDPRIGAYKTQIKAEMRARIKEKIGDVHITQRMSMQSDCQFGDIFDKYGIENQCCRVHILTETSFHKTLYEG